MDVRKHLNLRDGDAKISVIGKVLNVYIDYIVNNLLDIYQSKCVTFLQHARNTVRKNLRMEWRKRSYYCCFFHYCTVEKTIVILEIGSWEYIGHPLHL